MTRTDLTELWRERIEDFAISGSTAQEWADFNNIPHGQLQYWKRRLKQLDNPTQNNTTWAAIEIIQAPTNSITLRIGAASIDLNSGFNPSLLREIVQALEATPC